MEYKQTEKGYIIKLKRGERVVLSLTEFCKEQKIHSGIFYGIGAVKNVEMGYYDLIKKEYFFKKYSETMEVVSMTGNVALIEGDPFLHTHAVLSDTDNHAHGGHVKEAEVAVTLEIFLTPLEETLERVFDEEIGLNLLNI